MTILTENQVINNISIQSDSFVKSTAFSVTEKFLELQGNDRDYVKMLVKIDDYFARAFFAKKIVIVEGDTEDVVLRKTISILPKSTKDRIVSDYQFIKARGKATIPPLLRYFSSLGITEYFVIHDRDQGTPKAEEVNPRILTALEESEDKRVMLKENIEDTLGYDAPSKDKPFKAHLETKDWEKFEDIPADWQTVINKVFENYM